MPADITLTIRKAGMLTTIQDSGRSGYHHMGVPVSGPMDNRSARIANRLVGNDPGAPVLEITLIGPEIEVSGQSVFAITGADLAPKVNGQPVPMYTSIEVVPEATLTFGKSPMEGCRAYLAVAGVWHVQKWLGSASMLDLLPESILPKLHKGSAIQITVSTKQQTRNNFISNQFTPPRSICVLPGPEYHLLPERTKHQIQNTKFTLTTDSNRMGYRISPRDDIAGIDFNMISSGVIPGTVQLTNAGQLVILMRDAQTTGGYPRILQVISADMDIVGQFKPGDSFQFQMTDQDTARRLWKKYLAEEGKMW